MSQHSRPGIAAAQWFAALSAVALLASGCGSAEATSAAAGDVVQGGASTAAQDVEAGSAQDPDGLQQARTGAPAASERLRFKPALLQLPDGSEAPVQPVSTVNGELEVPENVDHLGWWDGGAYVNDPFGSTVIAGHIDSAEQGVGFFGKLLTMAVDDEVIVQGEDGGQLTYEVTSTELVDKDVLVDNTVAFDQAGPHRLVLITCSGRWIPELHSYESNFVVIAEPVGLAES